MIRVWMLQSLKASWYWSTSDSKQHITSHERSCLGVTFWVSLTTLIFLVQKFLSLFIASNMSTIRVKADTVGAHIRILLFDSFLLIRHSSSVIFLAIMVIRWVFPVPAYINYIYINLQIHWSKLKMAAHQAWKYHRTWFVILFYWFFHQREGT